MPIQFGSGHQSPMALPIPLLSNKELCWGQATCSCILTTFASPPPLNVPSAMVWAQLPANRELHRGWAAVSTLLLLLSSPASKLWCRSRSSTGTASSCPTPVQLFTTWKLHWYPKMRTGELGETTAAWVQLPVAWPWCREIPPSIPASPPPPPGLWKPPSP